MIRRIVTNNNVQTIFANENSDSVFIFKMDVEHVGDLTVPANSMLIFSGGTLTVNSGKIIGSHTTIKAPPVCFIQFSGTCNPTESPQIVSGTWDIDKAYPEWFGAVADGQTDCSTAIEQTMMLVPSEIHFISGVYAISRPIITLVTNVFILGEATIKALCDVNAAISYAYGGDTNNLHEVNCHSMIIGNYPYPTNGEDVYGLRVQPTITGGGCVDGNGVAETGVAIIYGYRTHISDLVIKNTTKFGFISTIAENIAGSCLMQRCVFINQLPDSEFSGFCCRFPAAIHNNKVDCTYENIEIVGYRTGVVHEAENGVFKNVHVWRECALDWTDTVAFHCLAPHISLMACNAENMRSLVQVWATQKNNNGFFANIFNCRASANISTNTTSNGAPIVICKYNNNNFPEVCDKSVVILRGGVFWYDIPFLFINNKSDYDRIYVTRYNRQTLNDHNNVDY